MFNMAQRSQADNSPVIQAGQQIAEMVPTVQRMMSEQYSRSRFMNVFKIRAPSGALGSVQ